MRILIVSQYFWPENFRINEIAIELKTRGHDVDVLTAKPNYPKGNFFPGYGFFKPVFERWKDINIYRLPIMPRGSGSKFKLVINYISFVIFGLLLSPLIMRKKDFDVIFVYAPSPLLQVIPASFLGFLKKIPVVLWVQDLWPDSLFATGYVNISMAGCFNSLVTFCYKHVDLILVQSKAFINPVSELAHNTPVRYYPNSVDRIFFSPTIIDFPEVDSLQTGFTILFAGNIGVAQSMETIVTAAEILSPYKEIKFIIMGDGSKFNWLSKEVQNRALDNIFLEGKYPLEAMPHLMRMATALLVTLSDQPIFSLTVPNRIQAYLAVGKPIIACLNGEGARIINEANAGLSVPAENSQGLAQAILQLYRMDKLEHLKFGNNGRMYFKKNFDEGRLIADLINFFKLIIRKEKS